MAKLIKVNSLGDEFDSDKGLSSKTIEEVDLKSGHFSAGKNIEKQNDLETNKK